jgi:hypothetical protein
MENKDKIEKKTEKNEPECPICEMNEKIMGVTIAHVACGTIKDEENRGQCMAWAAGINPETMSVDEMMRESYNRAGLGGLAAVPIIYNKTMRKTIITILGEKLNRGEELTDEETQVYNNAIKKEANEGL